MRIEEVHREELAGATLIAPLLHLRLCGDTRLNRPPGVVRVERGDRVVVLGGELLLPAAGATATAAAKHTHTHTRGGEKMSLE